MLSSLAPRKQQSAVETGRLLITLSATIIIMVIPSVRLRLVVGCGMMVQCSKDDKTELFPRPSADILYILRSKVRGRYSTRLEAVKRRQI